MVRETGIEPARRETLDPKSSASASSATPANFGDPTATRTRDTLIKSQVLYQLSYWVILVGAAGFEPTHAGVKVPCLTGLATPQNEILNCHNLESKMWGDWRGSNPRVTEPQSAVLTASPQPPCLSKSSIGDKKNYTFYFVFCQHFLSLFFDFF